MVQCDIILFIEKQIMETKTETNVNKNWDNSKPKKTFKDLTTWKDYNLDDIELIRGETPPDIKERCLELCKQYLSGNWTQQTLGTPFQWTRVSGVWLNQYNYCGITSPSNGVVRMYHKKVAIRLYGTKSFLRIKIGGGKWETDWC